MKTLYDSTNTVSCAIEHTTNEGKPKIVRELTYPATARNKVIMIFTDLAVIQVTPEGLLLKELYPGLTLEEIQSITMPKLIITPDLKDIEF